MQKIRSNYLFLRNSKGKAPRAFPGKTATHFSWNCSKRDGGATMTQWGRSADALPGVVAKGKFGKRSVMLALAAFAADAIVFTAMVVLPSGASELSQNVATGVFMTIFLLAAPLAHIAGLIFRLMALARSNDSHLLVLSASCLTAFL
jgi:hypothetical protein